MNNQNDRRGKIKVIVTFGRTKLLGIEKYVSPEVAQIILEDIEYTLSNEGQREMAELDKKLIKLEKKL